MSRDAIHRVISRACTDKIFRDQLRANPAAALLAEGIDLPAGVSIVVHEPADDVVMIVLPSSDAVDVLDKRAELPKGRVAGLPKELEMTWQGSILTISGEVTTESGVYLKREILKAFIDIDLDLSAVTFMGSGGLSALLVGLKHLNDHHAILRIINPSPIVASVMDISGFSDMFEILVISDDETPDPTQMFGRKVFAQPDIKVTNIDTPLV